jgi:inorganic pyrophosphatase
MKIKDYLGKKITIKIDRPLGTRHPKHNFIYLLNYGYVPNTISDDGEELDAYLLGVFDPVKEYHGRVIAIIHRTNDNDDKLVVVPDGVNYTDDQIMALTEFQERFFKSVIWNNKSKYKYKPFSKYSYWILSHLFTTIS